MALTPPAAALGDDGMALTPAAAPLGDDGMALTPAAASLGDDGMALTPAAAPLGDDMVYPECEKSCPKGCDSPKDEHKVECLPCKKCHEAADKVADEAADGSSSDDLNAGD